MEEGRSWKVIFFWEVFSFRMCVWKMVFFSLGFGEEGKRVKMERRKSRIIMVFVVDIGKVGLVVLFLQRG